MLLAAAPAVTLRAALTRYAAVTSASIVSAPRARATDTRWCPSRIA